MRFWALIGLFTLFSLGMPVSSETHCPLPQIPSNDSNKCDIIHKDSAISLQLISAQMACQASFDKNQCDHFKNQLPCGEQINIVDCNHLQTTKEKTGNSIISCAAAPFVAAWDMARGLVTAPIELTKAFYTGWKDAESCYSDFDRKRQMFEPLIGAVPEEAIKMMVGGPPPARNGWLCRDIQKYINGRIQSIEQKINRKNNPNDFYYKSHPDERALSQEEDAYLKRRQFKQTVLEKLREKYKNEFNCFKTEVIAKEVCKIASDIAIGFAGPGLAAKGLKTLKVGRAAAVSEEVTSAGKLADAPATTAGDAENAAEKAVERKILRSTDEMRDSLKSKEQLNSWPNRASEIAVEYVDSRSLEIQQAIKQEMPDFFKPGADLKDIKEKLTVELLDTDLKTVNKKKLEVIYQGEEKWGISIFERDVRTQFIDEEKLKDFLKEDAWQYLRQKDPSFPDHFPAKTSAEIRKEIAEYVDGDIFIADEKRPTKGILAHLKESVRDRAEEFKVRVDDSSYEEWKKLQLAKDTIEVPNNVISGCPECSGRIRFVRENHYDEHVWNGLRHYIDQGNPKPARGISEPEFLAKRKGEDFGTYQKRVQPFKDFLTDVKKHKAREWATTTWSTDSRDSALKRLSSGKWTALDNKQTHPSNKMFQVDLGDVKVNVVVCVKTPCPHAGKPGDVSTIYPVCGKEVFLIPHTNKIDRAISGLTTGTLNRAARQGLPSPELCK